MLASYPGTVSATVCTSGNRLNLLAPKTWAGIGVPRGTPPEIIERLNREVNAGLAQPDIRARLADVGTVPMILSAAAFKAYIASEAAKWDKVVKIAGIKPQ